MAMASNKMSDAGSQTNILGDGEGCLSGSKLEHTDIAASDLFNSPIVQNVGLIDLVESPPLPEFAECTLRMAADGYSGMGGE